jgi:hypothetical protein
MSDLVVAEEERVSVWTQGVETSTSLAVSLPCEMPCVKTIRLATEQVETDDEVGPFAFATLRDIHDCQV